LEFARGGEDSWRHFLVIRMFLFFLSMGVWGSEDYGFAVGVQGLGFGVWGLGLGVWCLGFGVWGSRFKVQGQDFWGQSSRFS